MARYIDADAVEKRIVGYYDAQLQSYPSSKDNKEKDRLLGGINYGRNVVRDAPTADVVPKSEVKWLESEVDRLSLLADYNHSVLEQEVQDAKAEVAREIFEEIEQKLLPSNTSGEFRGDSIEWFDYFDLHLAEDIAELKKKYTGDQT